MIRGFADKQTQAFWDREQAPKRLPAHLRRVAMRKLEAVDAAVVLSDLASPPGNRLEKLARDRAGHYSIRINQAWRICFAWGPDGPHHVEIVDYH